MSEGVGRPFQILALDGGGMKGAFTAAFLACIEEDCQTTITQHFDLIAGTSTGGIIAIGLGLGFSAKELLDFYITEGPRIFPSTWLPEALRGLFKVRYKPEGLVRALRKHFGERTFGESANRLLIPSYSIGEDDVHIFRTRHHERLKRDWKLPAWQIALATTAAPTYLPASKQIGDIRLVDGGVWANNPTMVALTEAYGTLNIPLNDIRILNIATCEEICDRAKSLDKGGAWQWRHAAIDVVMRGQSLSAANQASFLIGKDDFFRIAPSVPSGTLKLDSNTRTGDLIGKARHHSRSHMPRIERDFMRHIAPIFLPEP